MVKQQHVVDVKDQIHSIFTEEKVSEIGNLVTEYLKRVQLHLDDPDLLADNTLHYEGLLSLQLTRVEKSILQDGHMNEKALKYWLNGAAVHSHMLIQLVRMGKIRKTAAVTASQLYNDQLPGLLNSYRDYRLKILDVGSTTGPGVDNSQMDRVKNSMQQVQNPIPKVLNRRAGANSLEAEKENFERSQAVSINKAINAQEVAVKEKHARNILCTVVFLNGRPSPCILGTHHEKGALTFWAAVHRLPLSSNAVLCWKFCHVFHKLLRDGHHSVLKDSMRNKADLSDMSRMWGHLSEGYGKLCSIYLKLLITKMEFHSKNPRFPGNLMMTDKQLDEAGENDVNNFFQMTVEMFDYLECELNLFLAVFSSLDMSRSVSVTTAGLPADTLQGHRDRFQEQFRKLKDLFYRSSNLQYFKRLIQIPQLPENPPNFLRASALSEHISPVVVIPLESSSPDNEPSVETEELVDMDTALQPTHVESKFDDLFGTSSASDPFNFNSQNGMYKDDKDRLIEQLSRDIRALKEELETFKAESHRLCQALRGRISELEAELAEQTHLKQQALDEGEFLRAELEDLRRRREDTEKAQRSLTEVEKKAQANEQRYAKLKEKYTELVQSHAELLRKNAEVTRQVTVARAAQDEVESVRREMQEKLKEAQEESQHREKEQSEKLQVLQRKLAGSREQLGTLRASITSSQQMSTDLSSKIEALEQDKGGLAEAVTQKEAELSVLGAELEQLQSTLSSEREIAVKTAEALQNQLNEKARLDSSLSPTLHSASREQALERQLAAERLALLRSSVEEGERIIQDALARLEHPAHIGCTSSADYLVSRSQAALESLNRLQAGRQQYLSDPTDVSELLRAVAQLAHLVGDTIVQGSATSHMAPLEQADMLSEAVKSCGGDALAFVRLLKEEETLGSADSTVLREGLARITSIGEITNLYDDNLPTKFQLHPVYKAAHED
ncbi:UNVERIFIED_CONTAM: hypothetical protein FKN15_059529 [Acipenser sinensis]